MAKEKVLITGISGMLGGYLRKELAEEYDISGLGRGEENRWRYDLARDTPDFGGESFDMVVHAAGTETAHQARSLNLEGTLRLLSALEKNPPARFVYISSYKVYNPDGGMNVAEGSILSPADSAGESKAEAEREVTDWARRHGATLTVVRPSRMFGDGVGGETLQIFNDALKGWYVHIRGNDAKVSLVTALDVARGIKGICRKGGVYNAADGHAVRFADMVEAMTANVGIMKRLSTLPSSWAAWVWRLGRWMPGIDRNLNPAVASDRMKTLVLDGRRFAEDAGIEYHDTLEVISRVSRNYPYSSRREI